MGLPMPISQNDGSGNANADFAVPNSQSTPARTSFSINRAFGGDMTLRGRSTNPAASHLVNSRAATLPLANPGEVGVMKHGVVFQTNSSGVEGPSLPSNGGMGRGFSSSKSKEGAVGGEGSAAAAVLKNRKSLPAGFVDKPISPVQGGGLMVNNKLASKSTTNMRSSIVCTSASSAGFASQVHTGSVVHANGSSNPESATTTSHVTTPQADPDPRMLDFKTPEAAVGIPNTPYANFSRSSNLSISSVGSQRQAAPAAAGNSSITASQLPHPSGASTELLAHQERGSFCSSDAHSQSVAALLGGAHASIVCQEPAGTTRHRLCVGCGSAAVVRCSVCKAGYCSTDCQHQDWHYHKKECQPPPPLEEYSFTTPHMVVVNVKQEPASPTPQSPEFAAQQHHRGEGQDIPMPEQQQQVVRPELKSGSESVHHVNKTEERQQHEAVLTQQRLDRKSAPASVKGANVVEERPHLLKLVPRSVTLSQAGIKSKQGAAATLPSQTDDSKMNGNTRVTTVKKVAVSIIKQDEAPTLVKKDYPVSSAVSALEVSKTYIAMVTTINDLGSFTVLVFVEGTEDILHVGSVQLEKCPVITDFSPKVGQLVASQSLHDSTWCRSYVFGINDSGYNVCHIDFGYIETVVVVKPVPEGMCRTAPGTGLCAVLEQGAKTDRQALALLVKNEGLVHFKVTAAGRDAVTAVLLGEDGHEVGTFLLQSWYESIATLSAIEQTPAEEGLPEVEKTQTMEPVLSPRKVVEELPTQSTTIAKPVLVQSRDDSSCLQPVDPFAPDAVFNSGKPRSTASPETKVSFSSGGVRGAQFMLGDLKQLSLELGERYHVMPVWCEKDFLYVQLYTEELYEMFSKLIANMTDHCTLSSHPEAVHVGQLVCGYIEPDSLWYRALVVQIDSENFNSLPLVSLYLVDFGNTERVSLQHVRPFIRPFLDVPIACVKVALCGDVPKNGTPPRHITDVYDVLKDLVEASGQLLMHVVANNTSHSVTAGAAVPRLESLLVRIFDKDGLLCVNDTVLCMAAGDSSKHTKDTALTQDKVKEEVEKPAMVAQHQGKKEKDIAPAHPSSTAAHGSATGRSDGALPSAAAKETTPKPKEETSKKMDTEPAHLMYEDCKSLAMKPGENVDLVVLSAPNTHTIMVIPQKDIGLMEELETLSVSINNYCNSLKTVFYEPSEGEVVLAKFAQDGLWYRAACIATVPADTAAIVQYVDYGNVETVVYDCLVQMLAAFVRPLPFFAVHTVLEGSGDQPSSKERCRDRLAELLPPFSCVTAARVSAEDPETRTYTIALPHVLDTLRKEQLLD